MAGHNEDLKITDLAQMAISERSELGANEVNALQRKPWLSMFDGQTTGNGSIDRDASSGHRQRRN